MRPDSPAYAIVGRGRWSGVIQDVLSSGGRRVVVLNEAKRRVAEHDDTFRTRISADLIVTGAQIVWMCVPPCADLPLLIQSAISAGMHVVVEKPWLFSPAQTEPLLELARIHHVLIAIHFQYCFLNAVERLRLDPHRQMRSRFSGTFTLDRPDRLRIPAVHNLGSHLLAIREYAVPGSEVMGIKCGYAYKNERRVQVETEMGDVCSIDLGADEPLIQRFILRLESGIVRLEFTLNLNFAARVFDAVSALKGHLLA